MKAQPNLGWAAFQVATQRSRRAGDLAGAYAAPSRCRGALLAPAPGAAPGSGGRATFQVAARPWGGRHDPAVDTGNWDGFGLAAGGGRSRLATLTKGQP